MAEYVACYGHPPPEMKWPLFLALAGRAPMFWARQRLVSLQGVQSGIGSAFGGEDPSQDLLEAAYPVKERRPTWIKNTWGEDDGPEEEDDGAEA